MLDQWAWSCRYCGEMGPWSTKYNLAHPKGWVFNLEKGLVCKKCAKLHKIKSTEDIEKENSVDGNSWDCL